MEVIKVTTAKRETAKMVSADKKVDIKQTAVKNSQAEALKTSTSSEKVEISKKAIQRGKTANHDNVVKENRVASGNIEKALKAVRSEMKKASSALRGKQSYYTVNSNNEVILKIRDRATGDQIKQIPSEESVAAKKAFRQIADKLFDQTI